MLLRKTTRKQVKEIFSKFFEKYPTIESLRMAPVDEIQHIITPLGMEYKRAVLLKQLAEKIVVEFAGKVPLDQDALLRFPGVGMYAANAVLCFATGKDLPLVDTNVIRVTQRVFSLKSTKKRPRTDPNVWIFVSKLIPAGKAAEFNLAMLDFAAAVCTARKPDHAHCPIRDICDYYALHHKKAYADKN